MLGRYGISFAYERATKSFYLFGGSCYSTCPSPTGVYKGQVASEIATWTKLTYAGDSTAWSSLVSASTFFVGKTMFLVGGRNHVSDGTVKNLWYAIDPGIMRVHLFYIQ